MKTALRRLIASSFLVITSLVFCSACSPGTGFLSPEQLARREAALQSKELQDFQILGRYPTPDSKTLVLYHFIVPSKSNQDAESHLGFVVAEVGRWGLWHSIRSGDYSKPSVALIDEVIEYETTYQPGAYSAVFGRVLKAPLTIEANLDNGKVLIDRDGDEGFAFFGTDEGDPVQLSILDPHDKLVQIVKLNIKQDLALETLLAFLQDLRNKNYSEAAKLYGGSYQQLIDQNPGLDPQDITALWKNACEINGFQCLDIYSSGVRDQPSEDEFVIAVQLQDKHGNLFVQGPCCGASATETPPHSEFYFHVIKDASGSYKVMDLPPYQP